MKFQVKDKNSSGFVSVEIKGKEIDPEWLVAEVEFDLNGFSTRIEISLLLGELVSFTKQLKVFYSTLKGTAQFGNIEDNINLVFSTDGLGHVSVDGTLRDTAYKVTTTFLLETDQTYISDVLNDCTRILSELGATVS